MRMTCIVLWMTLTMDVALSATPSGREIADQVDKRSYSASQTYVGKLDVRGAEGSTQQKSWRVWRKGWGSAAQSLLVFTVPAEVKGVALLTIGKKSAPDLQWMYTPAIDKNRRIAPQEKKTRFLGTHFSYEDMEFRDVDDRDWELEGEETKDTLDCWVLVATPKTSEKSQYDKIRYWVRKDLMVFHEAHYFAGSKPRRILRLLDYKTVQGVPTPLRWEMTDTEKPGLTVLSIDEIRFNDPIDDRLFVPGNKPEVPR